MLECPNCGAGVRGDLSDDEKVLMSAGGQLRAIVGNAPPDAHAISLESLRILFEDQHSETHGRIQYHRGAR